MKKAVITFVLCLCSIMGFAQNITVVGTIVSKTDGLPVIGAAVIPTDNISVGTATDVDGNFTLSVPSNSYVSISCVGYKTITLPVSETMNIVLEDDALMMDELVVTGYTTQRKLDLTGSVAVVSSEDLKTGNDTDPMRALQGKVPGMTITTDGSPCGTGTVRIRGIGSFNSSRDPLYVIDGIPTNQTLNSLNVNDIESMQVLKDAASASIYGSRAANGVIIITTKKGKNKEKIDVNFSANVTAQFYTKQSTMDLLNTPEYATAMAQAALNDGLDPVSYAKNFGLNLNASEGLAISAYNPATGSYENYTVNGLYDGFINAKKTMRLSNTDWLKEMSRVGISHNYDLSLAKATETTSTMFSLGYKKNDGILKYTDFENIAARFNTSFTPVKWLTIGENATVTYTNQVNSYPMENALKMSSIIPVYEEDGETFGGPVGGMSDRQNP
ncbi:MAG: TonB-dependent receptor plug domain-containing protein, partial [Candidatus Cryptobacteroides sp.]